MMYRLSGMKEITTKVTIFPFCRLSKLPFLFTSITELRFTEIREQMRYCFKIQNLYLSAPWLSVTHNGIKPYVT